jgi:N6-adenosine-specific RNA methylase IME4
MTEPVRESGRKPEKFYRNVMQYAPPPYLELFGRTQRPGFTVRGDEATKFDGAEE